MFHLFDLGKTSNEGQSGICCKTVLVFNVKPWRTVHPNAQIKLEP